MQNGDELFIQMKGHPNLVLLMEEVQALLEWGTDQKNLRWQQLSSNWL